MKTQIIVLTLSMFSLDLTLAQTFANDQKSTSPYLELITKNEGLLKNNPGNANLRLELARTYKLNGQTANSLKHYEILAKNDKADPASILEYAELLRNETEYKKAKDQYLRYAQINPTIGNYFADACDFAINQLSSPRNCELENLKNGENTAINYKEAIITDSRLLNDITSKEAIPANPVAASLQTKSIHSKQSLQDILSNSSIENTNVSFSEDGSIVAFSNKASLYLDKSKSNSVNKDIFIAKVDVDGKWSEVSSFAYNNPYYSVCYPSLANNGKTLYFSSDMAGGYGAYDLYSSQFIDNTWSVPVNLGALINSPGNEISPYYKSGDLFFSSDWHKGFGGFDVFRTSQFGIIWTDVENIGPCVNSTKDDYNFLLDKNNDGYFVSNRENSEAGKDIYKTAKLVLKYNMPSLRAISNDEVSIKSPLTNDLSENISKLDNPNIVLSVDDPSLGFLPKEEQANKLYFVQIAAIANYGPAAEARLKMYTKYGNVYKSIEGPITKIRIGGYNNLNEGLALMKTLKKNGFKDVFVVADILTEGRCILVHKSSNDFATSSPSEELEGKLKIRVSEFKAPDWFDSSKISDLGKIEHWTKNGWTIIVIGSFNSPAEAIAILDKVKSRGFNEAYIVLEENGRLYRQN
ncbi:MAG: SPOR domain-containing protein [Saprospiraceae bacterium]